MVQLRGLGAHFALLHTTTYGRCLRQRRPPLPLHMHQDIHGMSLVHALSLFSPTRPPARHRHHRSTTSVCPQPPASTATKDDAGRQVNAWVVCRARITTLGNGYEKQGVRGDALGPRYAAAAPYRLLTPRPTNYSRSQPERRPVTARSASATISGRSRHVSVAHAPRRI